MAAAFRGIGLASEELHVEDGRVSLDVQVGHTLNRLDYSPGLLILSRVSAGGGNSGDVSLIHDKKIETVGPIERHASDTPATWEWGFARTIMSVSWRQQIRLWFGM